MYSRAKYDRCETRKHTNAATKNQDKGLIAHMSEPVDQQASNEVVFSQMWSGLGKVGKGCIHA